jgi:glycosyltransferase involved in cell wall biosynthesis
MKRLMILSSTPGIGTGYSNITQNLAVELKKLGYNVAITGVQSSYHMDQYRGIDVYPIMNDFHEATNVQAQIMRLKLNMKAHGTEVLLCIFQGDSLLNPFTDIMPDKTIWYLPIEGQIIYKKHSLFTSAQKVKKIISMTYSAEAQFQNHGITSTTIYPGHNPKTFRKGYAKSDEPVTVYFPAKNEEVITPAFAVPELKKQLKIDYMVGFIAQNFGVKKRFERLIEAFSIFAKDKQNVHLHLHTLPMHIKGINLLEILDYYNVKDKVTFSYGFIGGGGLSDNALNVIYNQFDVYASASSGEGFGMPILESMAAGVPQIHPDFPPFQELLGYDDSARGVLAKCIRQLTVAGEERALVDVQSLAETLEILYARDDFRKMLGDNAQKWASEFTWRRTALEFDKVIRSL